MTLDVEYLCSYYGEYGAPRVTVEDTMTAASSVALAVAVLGTVTIEMVLLVDNWDMYSDIYYDTYDQRG